MNKIKAAAGIGMILLAGSLINGLDRNTPSTPDALTVEDLFTERDLTQRVATGRAEALRLQNGKETLISTEGIYRLSGNYRNTSLVIDAGEDAKVQLILDNLTLTNESRPAVYVKSADKVFITTAGGSSSLSVTGTFTPDGNTHLDGVIFSRSDLVMNGTGKLEIISAEGNGISTKDDLKITGGTLLIHSAEDGLEANDSIRIAGGDITIDSGKDGLHSENDDDPLSGYIFLSGGKLEITAADDALRGTSFIRIDEGTISIPSSKEGLEATQIQINGGNIDIYAKDDGVNATAKSPQNVLIEVNGGNITVSMASGDTDGFDSNGDLYIRGGNIDVTGPSPFDADGTAEMTGGTVRANGTVVTEITTQSFGHGGGRRRW